MHERSADTTYVDGVAGPPKQEHQTRAAGDPPALTRRGSSALRFPPLETSGGDPGADNRVDRLLGAKRGLLLPT